MTASLKEYLKANCTVSMVTDFLKEKEGSCLRAWRKHFDPDNDYRVNESQFCRIMRAIGWPVNPQQAFEALDADMSGEVSLEEMDEEEAKLWMYFCEWCTNTFSSSKDMIEQLESRCPHRQISKDLLETSLHSLGWTGGQGDLLFESLVIPDGVVLSANHLRWLDLEKRRQHRKEEAKLQSQNERRRRTVDPQIVQQTRKRFMRYLKRTFGSYIRAWRKTLSISGTTKVSRKQFLTACSGLGFQADGKVLWSAFCKEKVQCISVEDLDMHSAEVLAHFQLFVKKLGGVAAAFRALDEKKVNRLRYQDFSNAAKSLGFALPTKTLFNDLDVDGSRFIEEEDLKFLEAWRLPAHLTASANIEAKEEVRTLLLKTYGNYLKAWRLCVDPSSCKCMWAEFLSICQKIGFEGDIPGAWRAFDDDLSGSITLYEFDKDASNILRKFKEWADIQFGGVRSAFGVFDDDGSNTVTSREFKHNCRIYGHKGQAATLFRALDVERKGNLALEDIAFLDDWEFFDPDAVIVETEEPIRSTTSVQENVRQSFVDMNLKMIKEKLALIRRKPQNVPPPERVWWNDLPCKELHPHAKTPRSRLLTAWCGMCKTRGPCRHLSLPDGHRPSSCLDWSSSKRTLSSRTSSPQTSRLLSRTPRLAEAESVMSFNDSDQYPRSARAQTAEPSARLPGLGGTLITTTQRTSTAPGGPRCLPKRSVWEGFESYSSLLSVEDRSVTSCDVSKREAALFAAEVQFQALTSYPMGTVFQPYVAFSSPSMLKAFV